MRNCLLPLAVALAIACGKNQTGFLDPPPPTTKYGILRLVNYTHPAVTIDWYWGDSLILKAQPFWTPYLIGLPVATKLLHAKVSSTGTNITGHEVTLPVNVHGSITMPAILAVAVGSGTTAMVATAPPVGTWSPVVGNVTFRVLHAGPAEMQGAEVGWSLGQQSAVQEVLGLGLNYGNFSSTYTLPFVSTSGTGVDGLVWAWIRNPQTGAMVGNTLGNWGKKPQLAEYGTALLYFGFISCSLREFDTGNVFDIPDNYSGPDSPFWYSGCSP